MTTPSLRIPAQPLAKNIVRDSYRLDFIDGLRGIAVLAVVLRHYYMRVYELGLPRWVDIFGLGYIGVHLFLVLSGFCISWAYVGDSARSFRGKEFAVRRATRILPAYYAALAISAVLAAPRMSSSELAWQVLTHATMTHNLFPSTVLGLNAPFWSLALECQLYLIFPLMLFGFRRIGVGATLILVLLFQTTFRLVALRAGTNYNETTFVLPWSVGGRIFEFSLGMYAAVLVSRRSLNRMPIASRWGLPFVVLLAFIGARWSNRHLGVTHPLTDGLWSVGFACLLLVASRPASLANRLLSLGPIVWVGICSYSIYLVYELVLHYAVAVAFKSGGSPLLMAPAILGPTVLVCYLFFRVVEYPAIRFFRQRLRLKRSTSEASASS